MSLWTVRRGSHETYTWVSKRVKSSVFSLGRPLYVFLDSFPNKNPG